jgi:putative oxidoreductase
MFKRLLQTTNDPGFTIIRLVLGLVFFAHGAQSMFGWFGGYGFAGTLSAFSTSGMPTPLALLVILTQFFGSVALICGISPFNNASIPNSLTSLGFFPPNKLARSSVSIP